MNAGEVMEDDAGQHARATVARACCPASIFLSFASLVKQTASGLTPATQHNP